MRPSIRACATRPLKVGLTLLAVLLATAAAADRTPESGAGRSAAIASDPESTGWLRHGRTPLEQRHSPLDQIDRQTVEGLGLAWTYDLGTRRGIEATPIVAGGVLYTTGSWSRVYALDAATGRELWTFDPKVPRTTGRYACCDVVNRGVAVENGRVFVGTIDGRLIALDAASGEVIWSVQTTDPERPYTITGAPRVAKGKVVIGNGGADLGVRGFFSAYDAATGERIWRFYTVPASKAGPHEHSELEAAAATWSADSMWESGLGGTVWDAFAYDPELDLLYAGVGNASVYDRETRSPGGGDNLYLASILAVRPDTGRLVWYYQTTPGESWDYTATQPMILADLEIDGRLRKVLMQAPKNGFFYVLDRATGDLLRADAYASPSWASSVDLETGRPVERPEALWSDRPRMVSPAPPGAHNWHPMSYSPSTGLVYLPVARNLYRYGRDPDYRFEPGSWNTGEDFGGLAAAVEDISDLALQCDPNLLVAWDPKRGEAVWTVAHHDALPAGVLSTAGGLVFQGDGDGAVTAYDDRDGRVLWRAEIGLGIMAPPITYAIEGVQYVVVSTGVGGSHGGHFTRFDTVNEGRVYAFRLGAEAPMPPVEKRPTPRVEAPAPTAPAQTVSKGRDLYSRYCLFCHGVGVKSSGLHPDLRHSTRQVHEQFQDIVLGGVRQARGMPSFANRLTASDVEAIHAYVIARAWHEPGWLEWVARKLEGVVCLPVSWLAD